jgi:hypothetical protein
MDILCDGVAAVRRCGAGAAGVCGRGGGLRFPRWMKGERPEGVRASAVLCGAAWWSRKAQLSDRERSERAEELPEGEG